MCRGVRTVDAKHRWTVRGNVARVAELRTAVEVGGPLHDGAHLEVFWELRRVGVAVEALWVERAAQRKQPQVLLDLWG